MLMRPNNRIQLNLYIENNGVNATSLTSQSPLRVLGRLLSAYVDFVHLLFLSIISEMASKLCGSSYDSS